MIYKNADWDNIWSKKFVYRHWGDWEIDIFVNISSLLRDIEKPQILSAGCGRGLIDYWLVNVFGYKVILLDNSVTCIKNLRESYREVNKEKFEICHASILDIPYPDNSFDLTWNEGVLEHFHKYNYKKAIEEMIRVSKKYILIDVPYARSKPYIMAKEWLEENDMWVWGYEDPKISLKEELESNDIKVLKEMPIGSIQTNKNYINILPPTKGEQILRELTEEDFEVFPHLMIIGEKRDQDE